MDNKSISKIIQKAGKLLELHEANPFKIRSYQNAAFNIDKLSVRLEDMNKDELAEIDGIGKNLVDKIISINETGSFKELDELLEKTPTGIVEMLDVKGVGPKKIRTLWKDYDINNKKELLNAAEEGKLADWKGFGEKTQKAILDSLIFEKEHMGKVYYALGEQLAEEVKNLYDGQINISGDVARKLEVVDCLQFVCVDEHDTAFKKIVKIEAIEIDEDKSGPFKIKGKLIENDLKVEFILTDKDHFGNKLLLNSCDPDHLNYSINSDKTLRTLINEKNFENEESIYKSIDSKFIPAELREGMIEWDFFKEKNIDDLLTENDLRGTLHNHSTYSDGKNTLKEMAEGARDLGLEYLGISDHSKSAFYANGLDESRIIKQHEEIDLLNKDLAPFKIFKGIESDILNDGSLDYENDVLSSFDFIVSSIHSGLSMDEKKATARLIKAIENPFTTILGHPTGRLLLRRQGYPINHKMVIDACAENGVIIEINANPWRLDLSWEWVSYALEKGVWISINPDAHELKGYHDMYYGVCVGRKGGLTKEQTFNAQGLNEVEKFFNKRKEKSLSEI